MKKECWSWLVKNIKKNQRISQKYVKFLIIPNRKFKKKIVRVPKIAKNYKGFIEI